MFCQGKIRRITYLNCPAVKKIAAGRYVWIFFLGLVSVVTTMKRDLDLARKILLTLEENEEATGHSFVRVHVKGYPLEQISYHVKLLNSAGLIEAVDISTLNSFQWQPRSLTWYGHEFLDASRDENIWKEAKKRMEKVKSFSFTILLEVLSEIISSSLTG